MDSRWAPQSRLAALMSLWAVCGANAPGAQSPTVVPRGSLHVEGSRIVDSEGNVFLIRGTQLPEFRTLPSALRGGSTIGFDPYSGTVLSTIRQRWNMNAVRIPLNVSDYLADPGYLQAIVKVMRAANDLELAVILTAHFREGAAGLVGPVEFWHECARSLRGHPSLIFELEPSEGASPQDLVRAIRSSGATQLVLVRTRTRVDDSNAVYSVSSTYATAGTERDRDRQFMALAAHVPVLVSGLDPELELSSKGCGVFPEDPSKAEALVLDILKYFDSHSISWVISEYRPGKLIGDYRGLIATSLENGWICGQSGVIRFGIGEAVQFHLWGGEIRGLFAVSVAGNFTIARGSLAIIYGAIFAEQDITSDLPARELAGVSIQITDSAGVSRNAGLLYASAGWGQANFVVPPGCALGPARVAVERRDGSRGLTSIIIADIAPGFWTASGDGRGPVVGFVRRAAAGRLPKDAKIYICHPIGCSALPVPVSPEGETNVELFGAGFRHAAGLSEIKVRIGRTSVPVIAFGPAEPAGVDRLTIGIPSGLRGIGEADLVCSVHGRLANVVRINLGAGERSR